MALSPIMRAAYALYKAGFRGQKLVNQLAIDGRESRYDPHAENLTYPDHSEGYGQINQLAHHGRFGTDAQLQRPYPNAVAQYKLSQGGRDLSPWKGPSGSWRDNITPAMFAAAGRAAAAVEGGGPAPAGASPVQAPQAAQVSPQAGQQRAALISQYLSNEHDPNALVGLATGLQSIKPVAAPKAIKRAASPQVPGAPVASTGSGTFTIFGANPGRLTKPLVSFAEKVAGVYGHPLSGNSGATHSKYTVDGNVSDHWAGNATDIPATGAQLIAMGRAALVAAGMPRAQAMKQTGGLYNVGGHQVIFNTHLGGDHTNHLHISV